MLEDNLFADQANPYQHLQQYEELCWLQDMAELSQRLYGTIPASSPAFVDTISPSQTIPATLQFEPFETERTAEMTVSEFLAEWNQETVTPADTIQADPFSAENLDSNGFDTVLRPAASRPT